MLTKKTTYNKSYSVGEIGELGGTNKTHENRFSSGVFREFRETEQEYKIHSKKSLTNPHGTVEAYNKSPEYK